MFLVASDSRSATRRTVNLALSAKHLTDSITAIVPRWILSEEGMIPVRT